VRHLSDIATTFDIPLWRLQAAAGEPISDDISITCIEEASALYRKADNMDVRSRELILYHWNRLTEEALEKATTTEELRRLYTLSPGDEVVRGKILLRRIEIADTVDEISAILGMAHGNIKVRYAAHEKWKDLTRASILETKTLTEALTVYRSAADSPRIKNAALMNCLQFVHTTAEAKKICLDTNATSECREIALRHWLGLASTVEELLDVHKHCFYHVDIRHETLAKCIELHGTMLEAA
jgi:hypothetical protein